MKNIQTKMAVFFLIFILLGCSMRTNVFAVVKSVDVTATPSATIAVDPIVQEATTYELPYPGLLPDNPLYVLKVIRDHMIGFVVQGSLKKAQFDLLQADKRLNAGVSLTKVKKYQAAEEIISKAENYFEEGIGQLEQAKQQGMDIKQLTHTMLVASKKHEMVVMNLASKMSQPEAGKMKDTANRVRGFEKNVKNLILDK